jgi:hypothetical protein
MQKQSSLRQWDKFALICTCCFWAMVALRNTDVFFRLPAGVTNTVLVLGFVSTAINLGWLLNVLLRPRIRGADWLFRTVLIMLFATFLMQIFYFTMLFHRS